MRTFLPALLAFALSLPPTALAQQNPFNIPSGGYSGANAGSSLALSWKPTTDGPVTLVLRSGDATDLQEGTVIASNAPNTGSFTWPIPPSITKGYTYTIQIVSAAGDVNYTPYFFINSANTLPSSTSVVATGAPTGAAALLPVPSSLAAAQSTAVPMSRASASASSEAKGVATSANGAASSAVSSMSAGASSVASSASAGVSSAMATVTDAAVASTAAAGAAPSSGATGLSAGSGVLAGVAGVVAMVL